MRTASTALLFLLPLAFVLLRRRTRRRARTVKLNPREEHVLVLGAGSGVGRALAVRYAARGARVCLVSRGEDSVAAAREEVVAAAYQAGFDAGRDESWVVGITADFTSAEAMVGVRERLTSQWGRLDTLVVAAGVSALKPILETAGIRRTQGGVLPDADLTSIESSMRIATAAIQGNFTGPYISAITFIPFMSRTSPSPSILLISSLAALVPAPTRALYGATKSASLMLYQSLAIEHPDIAFTCVIPSTIEGDFRKSAVDSGDVREANPNTHGLKRAWVTQRCMDTVDAQERTVFMADFYRFVPMLYYALGALGKGIVERGARKKYKFQA